MPHDHTSQIIQQVPKDATAINQPPMPHPLPTAHACPTHSNQPTNANLNSIKEASEVFLCLQNSHSLEHQPWAGGRRTDIPRARTPNTSACTSCNTTTYRRTYITQFCSHTSWEIRHCPWQPLTVTQPSCHQLRKRMRWGRIESHQVTRKLTMMTTKACLQLLNARTHTHTTFLLQVGESWHSVKRSWAVAPSTNESARKDSAAAGTESYVHSRCAERGGGEVRGYPLDQQSNIKATRKLIEQAYLQQKQHGEYARAESKQNWRNARTNSEHN